MRGSNGLRAPLQLPQLDATRRRTCRGLQNCHRSGSARRPGPCHCKRLPLSPARTWHRAPRPRLPGPPAATCLPPPSTCPAPALTAAPARPAQAVLLEPPAAPPAAASVSRPGAACRGLLPAQPRRRQAAAVLPAALLLARHRPWQPRALPLRAQRLSAAQAVPGPCLPLALLRPPPTLQLHRPRLPQQPLCSLTHSHTLPACWPCSCCCSCCCRCYCC